MTDSQQPDAKPNSTSRVAGIINSGVFLVVLLLGVAIYLTPLKEWLAEGESIKQSLAAMGYAAPAVFILGSAVAMLIGAPRLLLCSLAGLCFGFGYGLLYSQAGTLLGSWLLFVFMRWRGRDYALGRYPKLRSLSQSIAGNGSTAVFLVRQLPMNGFYNNVLLALVPIRHRHFLIGSFIGFLPMGVTACLLGAGMIQADFSHALQYISLALGCSLGLGWVVNRWVSRRASTDKDEPQTAQVL